MTKHTAGPWEADCFLGTTVYTKAGGRRIARCQSATVPRKTDIANARLIAAAPNMLIALEEVDRVINRDGVQSIQEWDKRLRAVSITLRKIIAKAKGEPTPRAA